MKRITKYFSICLAAGLLTSCDSFLDCSENDFYTLEEIKINPGRVQNFVNNVYSYLPSDFCGLEGGMQDAATDDAVHVYKGSKLQRYVNGTWSANATIDDKIGSYYKAIHDANYYMDNMLGLKFESWENHDDYESWMQDYVNSEYEIRFLRAFYYFELVKRYNQVPLILHALTQEEANAEKPVPAQQIFDFVKKELTDAADNLPINYDNFKSKQYGRITKGMALALKARVLLYEASPLFNTSNSKSKWVEAAEAAYEVIGQASTLGYALDGKFQNLFGDKNHNSKEVIWYRPTGENNDFEKKNYPMGVTGGQTSTCPTENLASAFEMANGDPFDWNNAEMKKNPYSGRDPRFYETIVHNGMSWPNKEVEIFEGGANGLPLLNATTTGYYLRKYVNKSVSFEPGAPSSKPKHNWILIRYADVLLGYAEAMINAYGDCNTTTATCGMSAIDALNKVRTRVHMPAISNALSASEFLEKVKHERRVELAFEGHRFWDLRRWKELDKVSQVYSVRIVKSAAGVEYTKTLLETREINDKMYFYPIPNSEIFKNKNWIQNPGW